MNLILLHDRDWIDARHVQITNRRYRHLLQVLKVVPGKVLKVGQVNGRIGIGTVVEVNPESGRVILELVLDTDPPPPSSVSLILAMPRPLVFRRVLMHAVTLGVKQLFIVGSQRVEKSYFHTPLLHADSVQAIIEEALEQAVDTQVPSVTLYPQLHHFIHDEDALLSNSCDKYLAAPGAESQLHHSASARALLAIGPEGGFVASEVERLCSYGFLRLNLGPRILRVETAVCVALARIMRYN